MDPIKLIISQEGFSSRPYWDCSRYSIGYGTLAKEGDPAITREEAERRLREYVEMAVIPQLNYVKVPLSEIQQAVLIDFIYNLGGTNFRESTLLQKLNAGNYSDIPDELLRWCKCVINGVKQVSPGLLNRRKIEARLWEVDLKKRTMVTSWNKI